MRAVIATAILLMCGPAFGANCPYVNDAGDKALFVDDGENTVQVTSSGTTTNCTWGLQPDDPIGATIECDDGSKAGYFFASATRRGTDQSLLIFHADVWYRTCP